MNYPENPERKLNRSFVNRIYGLNTIGEPAHFYVIHV